MTQPPHLPLPPFGDDTDEALTALLDGELGAFAAERGLTEAAARDQLEQWPELAARLAALTRVRASVQEAVPPLDDLTRRRLVRAALPAEPAGAGTHSAQNRSWLRLTAAAAAALVLVAGLAAVITSTGGRETASDQASSAGSVAAPQGALGDLGDVSDPATLRALLDPEAQRSEKTRESASSTTVAPSGAAAGSAEDRAALSPPVSGTANYDRGFDPQACAAQLAGSRPVTFVGTGTFEGQAVTVVGLEQGDRTIALVVPEHRLLLGADLRLEVGAQGGAGTKCGGPQRPGS